MRAPRLVLWSLLVACKRGNESPSSTLPPLTAYAPLATASATPAANPAEEQQSQPAEPPQPLCEAFSAGEFRPALAEAQAAGAIERRLTREMPAFSELVSNADGTIVFKDEEGTGADRLMAPNLQQRLGALGFLVAQVWPGLKLRVTEAWDENGEHSAQSLHYEGRAADVTTSDRDGDKLGCLAGLAVRAGFDWVFLEGTHVHASVKR